MTITTLEHIHKLLMEDVKHQAQAVTMAREARNRAEDEEADNLKDLVELYRKVYECLSESREALKDFEEQEW